MQALKWKPKIKRQERIRMKWEDQLSQLWTGS